jgi:hypothetical protein
MNNHSVWIGYDDWYLDLLYLVGGVVGAVVMDGGTTRRHNIGTNINLISTSMNSMSEFRTPRLTESEYNEEQHRQSRYENC